MTNHATTIDEHEKQRVREILSQELELEEYELNDQADFVDDYDADSLSLITLVGRIESELGVSVPDTEWKRMTNLNQVFTVIGEYTGKEPAGA